MSKAVQELPTASLDDVAEQIRKDFAKQTGGCCDGDGCGNDATPPDAPDNKAQVNTVLVRKKISQETFDEVVKENIDDFEMSVEEAMKDAVEQFTQQGVDLSMLDTSPKDKERAERMANFMEEFNKVLQDPTCTNQNIIEKLEKLTEICSKGGEEDRMAAGKHGAVGAAAFVVKKHLEDKNTAIAGMKALGELLKAFGNREILPFQGAEAIVTALEHYGDCGLVQAAGFQVVSTAITKHEANKRNFKDLKINDRLLHAISTFGDEEPVVTYACKFLRIYLSDDDRRPGVQPGTFARAREIGESYEQGALKPLFEILEKEKTIANVKLVSTTLTTIKAVSVNDLICKHVANRGGLDISLLAFEAHITDETVAANSCMLLRAVSRNDDIKRTVGKGKGLSLLLRALEDHIASPRVSEQALQCLSVLCLRQPENCETIENLGCVQLIVSAMQKHPERAGVQRPAISTLRNMVSSHQNKDLVGKILDAGVEPLIRKARKDFPEVCEEVAYAALRDLNLDYQQVKK